MKRTLQEERETNDKVKAIIDSKKDRKAFFGDLLIAMGDNKPNYKAIVDAAIGEKPSLAGRWIEDKQTGLKILVAERKPFNIPNKNAKQDTK